MLLRFRLCPERLFSLILLLTFTLGLASRAAAARRVGPPVGMGAELNYTNVAPGVYYVVYRFHADCASTPDVERWPYLRYRATGCDPLHATRDTVNAGGSHLLQPRRFEIGNPYCPGTGFNRCDTASAAVNYATQTFIGILHLGTGPAATCARWTLSVSYGTHAPSRNVLTDPGLPLYTETELNTIAVRDDSSPTSLFAPGFSPLIFVCDSLNPTVALGFMVDPDNYWSPWDADSLSFALEAPWWGPHQPLLYQPGYSVAQPLPTAPGHPVVLDPVTGTFSFLAAPYVPGTPPALGRNKYALAYRVTSWRRPWGTNQRVRTGSVRRETTVVLFDCPRPPLPPVIEGPDTTLLGGILADTIQLWLTEPDRLRLLVTQPTCADSIATFVAGNQLPDGLSVSSQLLTHNQQWLTFSWRPGPGTVVGYYPLLIRYICNSCPIPVGQDFRFVFDVRRRPTDPADGDDPNHGRATAAPNPFTDETRLTLMATAAAPTDAAVRIYDLTGRLVDWLRVPAGAGSHELTWYAPAALPAGVYVARYRSGVSQQVVRLVKE